jgi:hypothetical protein
MYGATLHRYAVPAGHSLALAAFGTQIGPLDRFARLRRSRLTPVNGGGKAASCVPSIQSHHWPRPRFYGLFRAMTDPRIIAAGATIAIIAAAGLFLARPEAPPPALGANGEPWPRARTLLGTWKLSRDTPYHENDCEGVDNAEYELVLDKVQTAAITGRMTMRFTRKKGTAVKGSSEVCVQTTRGGGYDISVAKDSFGQMEMTMIAKSCDNNGKSCPLVNLAGNIRQEGDVLVFASDRLQKVQK